jgi:SAM-dependent methyltransferase
VRHGEFRHPRLVEVYDAQFASSPEDDFFQSIVGETPGARVVDLGCGTGRLALRLAAAGHRVTGVDPAGASLDAARAKPGADCVTWVEGASPTLPEAAFDVALMTSHVAQFLVADEAWHGTLGDLRRALVPGGRLVFDTRDPGARGWERWNPRDSRRTVTLAGGTAVDVWSEVTAVEDDTVRVEMHYVFDDGDELVGTAAMRFRPEDEVRAAVSAAGFEVTQVYGGRHREPVGCGDGELVVLARRLAP